MEITFTFGLGIIEVLNIEPVNQCLIVHVALVGRKVRAVNPVA